MHRRRTTVRVGKWVMPMMMSRNFANRWPCRGFIKKSATMILDEEISDVDVAGFLSG